ncbi:MAG TPA: adenylate/guanylate cyclase domain-containing protein, partial [Candidatus Acidoferrum sp.]|nr:adenylate/guanylate cyclase domain-containing protein [Candidatus Acidoferrum sp.]
DYEPGLRRTRFMVTSRGPGLPGEVYDLVPELMEPLELAFGRGIASSTRIYENQHGTWITAFAPILDRAGRTIAVLDIDYRIDIYLARLARLRRLILGTSVLGGLVALFAGILLARRVTGPVSALSRSVARVAAGDLSETLPVRSQDEVGRLTAGFNAMLDGLRQRDFIRDTFGRYVSPEVVQTLLESPENLGLGGVKRDVSVLISDLRGYTRFVEQGDPTVVVDVLNRYLGRMTDIIGDHGGTINEFAGDGIVAFFGAPLPAADHAERAAACAIAMQIALEDVNRQQAARGLPRLEMGIGLNSGEAIVGNIGSEKRAKYTVIGTVINLAARVEACTVGGQVLLSPDIYERIRQLAEVGPGIPVEVKGIRNPLLLHELRGLRGRYDRRMPEGDGTEEGEAAVDLPATCWLFQGKTIRAEVLEGAVVRVGTRRLTLRLDDPLTPLQNVRLRLRFPTLGQDSEDLYGKVGAVSGGAGGWLMQIGLTSVNEADRQILERIVRSQQVPSEAAGAGDRA